MRIIIYLKEATKEQRTTKKKRTRTTNGGKENGKEKQKVVALLLALLMVFSVCSPISGGAGLGSTSAKAGNSAQPATASDAEESEKGITPLANPNGLTLSDFEITVNGTVVKMIQT